MPAPPPDFAALAFDLVTNGILLVDADDIIRYANPSAGELFRIEPSDLVDRPSPVPQAASTFELPGGAVCAVRSADLEGAGRLVVLVRRDEAESDVATGVLHNVGNVLNSVNVSVDKLASLREALRVDLLHKTAALVSEHEGDLGRFLSEDPRGRKVPGLLARLAVHQQTETRRLLREIEFLKQSLAHASTVIAAQQRFAKALGTSDTVSLDDIIDLVLDLERASLARHDIEVVREAVGRIPVHADRHQVLQILHNLVRNAIQAMVAAEGSERVLRIATRAARRDWIEVRVVDTGAGIAPEVLERLFERGVTTREEGHGFGLHASARGAEDLGGSLEAHSDGEGQGATFVLELPRHGRGSGRASHSWNIEMPARRDVGSDQGS